MRCKYCGGRMIKIYHFEKNKNYSFDNCPICYSQSKTKKLDMNIFETHNEEVGKRYEKQH